MKPISQKLSQRLAEVNFRKKLVQQHLGKKNYFSGQPDNHLILKELKKRVDNTQKDILSLLKKKITISPFLEIGAEKCQRSLLLVNQFAAQGFAADISLSSLKSAPYFSRKLNFTKLPVRVCLDAYHLPFRDNSLPFVFYYETLHHFPDPKPILAETERVIRSDGFLFFAEEPIKQLLNLGLWRRDFKLTKLEKLLKYTLILPFLSTIGKSEVEHGILEETFWLDVWEKSIEAFYIKNVKLKPVFFGPEQQLFSKKKSNWLKPNLLIRFLLALQGGGITALASVRKNSKSDFYSEKLEELFACPTCKQRPPLTAANNSLYCVSCSNRYRKISNIWLLLPKHLEKKLYPELS